MRDPRTILITGASSGIGSALALEYAATGVTLFLGGRNRERLTQIAELARAKGAAVEAQQINVADAETTRAWIQEADASTQSIWWWPTPASRPEPPA